MVNSEIFEKLYMGLGKARFGGKVASYIPELGNVEPDRFGVSLTMITGESYHFGDHEQRFSLQSVSKVFALALAEAFVGEKLRKRVGVEPSGAAFNSLTQLELHNGIPRNPMLNAGALVVCDVLLEQLTSPKEDLLAFVRRISGSPNVEFNDRVAKSELKTGFRNEALVQFMRSCGNINSDLEELMDFYCNLCAIEMTTAELSQSFSFLANRGVNILTGESEVRARTTRRINAIMQTCGFYDEAGEFAFRVGLPGKSGVGGGIAAVHPGEYSIAVWSPRLGKKFNSYAGMRFLESWTTYAEDSVF
ncbi:MAG: glutaminase [Saprospiraceae bacterium]